MDRLNQIKGESGGSRDLTLDTSSPPSESFMTANESSSKYFSLSEVDSTFDVSPSKDSAISTTADSEQTLTDSELISNLSPIPKKVDSFQIGKQIEAANILSGGVDIFDDNDNSYDGDELVIDDNVPAEESAKPDDEQVFDKSIETAENPGAVETVDTEVVLQIDGKNVNAIAIGNGLYLYRKGVEELAAIQMIDDNQQQPSFKFLKVRDNAEGNLEVYEEIEVEVPNKVPAREGKAAEKKSNVPVKDTSSQVKSTANNKLIDDRNHTVSSSVSNSTCPINTELQAESKSEVNFNGKKVKLNESRKSPLISTFTPMTYNSTPNKEGIPLTKTMVDLQLHPNRQSDNVKKTIEVHTDSCKKDSPVKDKDCESIKPKEVSNKTDLQSEILDSSNSKTNEIDGALETENIDNTDVKNDNNINANKELLPTAGNVQEKLKDKCKKNIKENLQTKIDETLSLDKTNQVENSIISTEKQTEVIENHTEEVNKKSKNDCESDVSNKVINKSDIDSKTLSEKTEKSENTEKTLLEDNKQKCDEIKSQEPIKPVSEQDKDTPQDENPTEDVISVPKPDDVKEELAISDTVHKTDVKDKVTEVLIKPDKNIEEDKNNKICANETAIATEKISKDIETDIKTHADEVKSQILNNLDQLSDLTSKTEDLANKVLISKTESETSQSINITKLSEPTPILNTSNLPKSIKSTEAVSNSLTEQKNDLPKTESRVQGNSILNEKQINDKSDIVKDSKLTIIESKRENEATKVVENITKVSSTNTEVRLNETKEKDSSEIKETGKLTDNITRQPNKLEIEKKPNASSKGIPHTQTSTKQQVTESKSEISKIKIAVSKPNNNCSAVPFGKWTEANRQEFLNKIKETKIPCSTSNTKQLKQPNDLNRRDVLKKIDTQRQAHLITAKIQESTVSTKTNVRAEPTAAFVNKPIPTVKTNDEQRKSQLESNKNKPMGSTISFEEKYIEKNESLNTTNLNKVPTKRKEMNNQDLIDKTIEGIISRAVSTKPHEDWKQTIKMDAAETLKHHNSIVSLDDMEKKMNELHGIPFVERPAHELPKVSIENKSEKSKDAKTTIPPPLLPFKNNKDIVPEHVSDEEISEHPPVTGDMTAHNSKVSQPPQPPQEKIPADKTNTNEESKKAAIITEKDFDKFARRNSITYEKSLTVKFDGRESHNVIQTLVEKEIPCKKLTRNEIMLAESKAKSTNKHLMMRHNITSTKTAISTKGTGEDDSYNKNYQSQSKVQLAYQSALTAKRQLECPVAILEEKPVKVVFLESGSDFAPATLNVQGQELSPSKKVVLDSDSQSASESLDSDVVDSPYEAKTHEDIKSKSKHQRKQVLTPVGIPELELIEPRDLGISESPKKRRRVEETKEKPKVIAPKKSYLLNRATADNTTNVENPVIRSNENVTESKPFDAISAIDNLVKAAELIETQSEKNANAIQLQESDASSVNTPTKRGRGRPRKYPLSETSQRVNKTPTPKKPRLIDSPPIKKTVESDSSDSDSDGQYIKENWTMGKINENIVCPICNKLFRSENVVFKHVKHCTGPSPNRSESSRSLRKFSPSEGKSGDSDSNFSYDSEDDKPIKPRAKETKPEAAKKEDVIVIEDTPQKKVEESKPRDNKPAKSLPKSDNLVCEFCGKTFRQLSYLVNHRHQHKKEEKKIEKVEKNDVPVNKSIFSCEVCKKEFRKLHHLVQHRIIHNPNTMSSRVSRKNSNEKNEHNSVADVKKSKADEDQSAGFRCEPCDKSFRKLHHLVEHRETHDGINKKVSSSNNGPPPSEPVKTTSNHVCGFCKKSFKKLQQLNEHKEQHCDACSEKSDDVKSVKSSLSTKDIIHECSLCYMVFPNEHSLTKHAIICLRKKKQSAAKQAKLLEQKEKNEQDIDDEKCESDNQNQSDKECEAVANHKEENIKPIEKSETVTQESKLRIEVSNEKKVIESKIETVDNKPQEVKSHITSEKGENSSLKRSIKEEENVEKSDDISSKKQSKIRKIEVITIPDTPTPKKKVNVTKEKRISIETKRRKSNTAPPEVKEEKSSTDASDDDEVRYMLNPNIKQDVPEEKVFMKVRANKRSSLQFERPSSKDLVKRRISLQNPPKVQRSKPKVTEQKVTKPKPDKTEVEVKTEQTDSDDSDVKYSFPETTSQTNENNAKTPKKESTVPKRKSITGIARMKLAKHKIPVPSQKIKRRTTEAEHRCDCGQLFSSAALLSRHTTLAHTPPRVRRPRELPPLPEPQKPPADRRKTLAEPKVVQKKTAATSVAAAKTRKSVVDNKSSGKVVKSESNSKTLRSAHKGVPVPDKMKKFMEKYK